MSDPVSSLRDRVAVVTGASGAIGRAASLGLAHAGASVALVARNAAGLDAAESALREAGGRALTFCADVRDPVRLAEVREEVLERCGRIDALVNLAGGNMPAAVLADDASPFELDLDAFRAAVELNLVAVASTITSFGPALAESPSGDASIVNVSSMAASRALTRVGAYGAAKAGVESLTRWFAVEFARREIRIRVNAIAPGFILGEQNRAFLIEADGNPTPRGDRILTQTPLGRLGEPADMVAAIVWLCGSGSAYVTGAVVPLDGGFSAFSGV